MPIAEEHFEHYREHGYAIIEGLLTADEIQRTLDEIEASHPGWVDFVLNPTGKRPEDWAGTGINRRQVRFPFRGEQLIRSHPVGMIMRDRGDDQLVRPGRVAQLLELAGDLGR